MFEKVIGIIDGVCIARGHAKSYSTRIKNTIFRYLCRTNSENGRLQFVTFIRNGGFESQDFKHKSRYCGEIGIEILRETRSIMIEWGI